MPTYKEQIEEKISGLQEKYESDNDFTLIDYPKVFDNLSIKEFEKVLLAIGPDYTDVDVSIEGEDYVVEITCVDNEIGLGWLTKSEYINRYGDERYQND